MKPIARYCGFALGALCLYCCAYLLFSREILHGYTLEDEQIYFDVQDSYFVLGRFGEVFFYPINALHRRLDPDFWEP